ncbi:MAG: hypothetical protein HZA78_02600 [Candidatus Schekmanbacteria bacterium]|nr:hypothetical protein [Candidatus Schekmanbacteria bacterium]
MISKISEQYKISKNKIILAEGRDDCEFLDALRNSLHIDEIEFIDCGGKEKLKKFVKNLLKLTSGFSQVTSLGIVIDADTNEDAAFQSITGTLMAAGLPVPVKPLEAAGTNLKVTVIVLPGRTIGTLEDLCLKSVENEMSMQCVEAYFDCLKSKNISEPREISKAKCKVYLASKPEAVPHIGVAAAKGYWPLESSVFDQLRQFLISI